MNTFETDQYAALIDKILKNGEKRPSRAGDTYSILGSIVTGKQNLKIGRAHV